MNFRDYNEFLIALEKALLTANRLRAVRLDSFDPKGFNPFIFVGSFLANGGKTYAFMVNEHGEGTYRCQAGPNYANEPFEVNINYRTKFPILELIMPEESGLYTDEDPI